MTLKLYRSATRLPVAKLTAGPFAITALVDWRAVKLGISVPRPIPKFSGLWFQVRIYLLFAELWIGLRQWERSPGREGRQYPWIAR